MAAERELDCEAPSQPQTTFFSLPQELRDQIYDLVVRDITAGPSDDSGFSSVQPRPAHKLCIKGGRISRQFRAEFLPRLHRTMTFMIFDYRSTQRATRDQKFIEIFGPSRIPLSRRIQFCGGESRGCKHHERALLMAELHADSGATNRRQDHPSDRSVKSNCGAGTYLAAGRSPADADHSVRSGRCSRE